MLVWYFPIQFTLLEKYLNPEISEWVKVFNHSVDRHFWKNPVDKQVEVFLAFFDWLVDNGYIEEIGTAETIIEMDKWLKAQQVDA